jgi:NAD(P)-dependent dehydrogenase (short-subunit alcohol dehydrogenase family)
MAEGVTLIVGGTKGLGRHLAERIVERGGRVVITGRDSATADSVAGEIGAGTRGLAFDLSAPETIAGALADLGRVDAIVLAAIERDSNTVRDYDVALAIRLVTLKLVGYTEVLHALAPSMHDDTAILLFGGLAKERPYPGSTTVTSINGAVATMVRTFATELAPVRVNAVHPGIVGDSPQWVNAHEMLDSVMARTPTRRLVTMDDVADAALFLLSNRSINGVNLNVDGGWTML